VSIVESGPLLAAVPVAIAAGILGFASPCVLPLVPGYLSYVTGMSDAPRSRTLIGAVLFVLGFTAVFVAEGAAFGQLGRNLKVHERGIELVLGIVTIAVGLLFAGALDRLPTFQRSLKPSARPAVGLATAPALGVLFGVGWTPCLGPTIATVLGLAQATATAGRGALLALAYCLGLGVPFILVAMGAGSLMSHLKRHQVLIARVGGLLLVATGVLEATGVWGELTTRLTTSFGTTGVGGL
jgi:cytochrome c-type biogenesis protein